MFEETIIAVSTPLGHGGLGVVRLSGTRSLEIALQIFRPRRLRRRIPPRQSVLGQLFDPKTGEPFETAMLIYYPGPHSYTTEDVIEISTHGSPVILEETVRLGTACGARSAHPGEFTLRAFLGGRIDILQAEAVNDLIRAASLNQAKISFSQMEGRLSKRLQKLRRNFIHILAQIEASIEFPDDSLSLSTKSLTRSMTKSQDQVNLLIESYDLGKTLNEGTTLPITGRTNAGKSTLFNALLMQDRAIVTPYPGTTRDTIREQIKIQDSVFTLMDTAGHDNTNHPIEREGIQRSRRSAEQADGILLVLDLSRPANQDDLELLKEYRKRKTLIVLNKSDLPPKLRHEKITELAPHIPQLKISALQGSHIKELQEMLYAHFVPDLEKTEEIILHQRQKIILEQIREALTAAQQLLYQGYSEEILAEEVRRVIPLLGQLTGEVHSEDVLQDIFSRFCIGK